MPNTSRLTGRFFSVLISLSFAILLPRTMVAGEAVLRSPVASSLAALTQPLVSSGHFSAWSVERRYSLAALFSSPRFNALDGAGPTLCEIDDTVYRADGTPAQGTIVILWPAFTTAAGQPIAPGSLTVQLGPNGHFDASLAPNAGASPVGTYYRATYKLNELKAHMRWVVGNGNEGKIQEIEGRVDRHEAYLQRFTGIGAALASLLTLFHFAIDYLRYKH